MIYLIIAIVWYLIGSIGILIINLKVSKIITIGDIIMILTMGGMGGLFTVIIGGLNLFKYDWFNKRVFKL